MCGLRCIALFSSMESGLIFTSMLCQLLSSSSCILIWLVPAHWYLPAEVALLLHNVSLSSMEKDKPGDTADACWILVFAFYCRPYVSTAFIRPHELFLPCNIPGGMLSKSISDSVFSNPRRGKWSQQQCEAGTHWHILDAWIKLQPASSKDFIVSFRLFMPPKTKFSTKLATSSKFYKSNHHKT